VCTLKQRTNALTDAINPSTLAPALLLATERGAAPPIARSQP
jgi:hypothetical protein